MIYIALIKTDDNKPLMLVIRDDVEEMKDYLLSIPVMHVLESFTTWDSERQFMKHYSLGELVKFLKD